MPTIGLFSPTDVRERRLDGTWPLETPITNFEAIDAVELATTASSVVFSSIPSTYRDLVLIGRYQNSTTTDVRVRPNGVSSYNASMRSTHLSAGSYSQIQSSYTGLSHIYPQWGLTQNNVTAGNYSHFIVRLYDYNATTSSSLLADSTGIVWNTTNTYEWFTGGFAYSSSAVTSITISPVSGTFLSASKFELYGVGQQ